MNKMPMQVRAQVLTCKACDLRPQCSRPVPWSGEVDAEYIVLGEAPGRQEDEAGRPFVGPSGVLTRSTLKRYGLDPDDGFWMNTVSCWPGESNTPTSEQVSWCAGNRYDQMGLAAQAHLVLVLGGVAAATIRPDHTITQLRGKLHQEHRAYFFAFHPAAALRDADRRAAFTRDLETFAGLVRWCREAGNEPSGYFAGECAQCDGAVAYRDEVGLGWCAHHRGRPILL